MMSFNKNIKIAFWVTFVIILSGCTKFLEEKTNKAYAIPEKLADFQALLDNTNLNFNDPISGEISSDNYYLTSTDLFALSDEGQRRAYTWEKDYLFSFQNSSWRLPYSNIYYANTVIDNISKVERTATNSSEWDNILGQALFVKARSYFNITAIFTKAFDPSTAKTDLGIPLRSNSDFNIVSERSTLEETFDAILSELKTSAKLLPVSSIHVLRASKPAVFGLLSRVYLTMGNYDSSLKYANLCLQLKSDLIDYNTLTASATYPFKAFNAEVLFHSYMPQPAALNMTRCKIDSTLYKSYANNDLRKTLFFRDNGNGSFGFRGSYFGDGPQFTGIATDEIWLTRAECFARKEDKNSALADLNTLMVKRWKAGTFVSISANDAADALDKILIERRKELLMRALRWADLKRLNFEGRSITLTRIVNGTTYTLPPNDLRYALAIPEEVINLSKIKQNPR